MASQEDFMQAVAKEAFQAVVKKMVEGFFADRWGYHDQREVAVALKEAVTEMIRTDPEIKERIKTRLLEVITRGESYS